MKRIPTLGFLLLLTVAAYAQPRLGKDPIQDVIAAMTLEEKAGMVIGNLGAMESINAGSGDMASAMADLGFDYPGLGMPIGGVPRLGVPVTICSDGSYGLKRYMPMRNGKYGTTAFPIPIAVASSWDTALAEKVASAYGEEGKDYGVDVLLGPAMNIIRDPLCGRNFEYYSEDPLLSGKMGSASVKGIQSNGIGTTIKHFVANNQETDRVSNDSRVSTRALREIYLRGFEMAAKEADPWFLMVSYNKLNGTFTTENRELLQTIVRGDWQYPGAFMSDFGGNCWAPSAVAAGNDLVMPGSKVNVQNIVDAVNKGELSMEALDYCVANVLRYVLKTPRFNGYKYNGQPNLDAHAAVAREAAAESMVLLKNDGALPIKALNPAFFGVCSYRTWTSGMGSGRVVSDYTVNIADAFPARNAAVEKYYREQIAAAEAAAPRPTGFAAIMASSRVVEVREGILSDELIAQSARESDMAVFTLGRNAGEGADRRSMSGDWLISDIELVNLGRIADAFHGAGKKVIVLLNVNGIVETASWKDLADAILLTWLPGQEGGNAIADILSGKVNPSGKLPATFPNLYMDVPTYGNFPTGMERSTAIADNGFQVELAASQTRQQSGNPALAIFQSGSARYQPKPEKYWVKNIDYTNYEEDVYVGYRYYNTFGVEVSYPFGFGLSYTTFQHGKPVVKCAKDHYEVTVAVTNTGSASGKDVVEIYVEAPAVKAGRPQRELLAFAKTGLLAPGGSQTVTLRFSQRDLSRYDEERHAFVLDRGNYRLCVAANAVDPGVGTVLKVRKSKVLEVTSDVCKPNNDLNRLRP